MLYLISYSISHFLQLVNIYILYSYFCKLNSIPEKIFTFLIFKYWLSLDFVKRLHSVQLFKAYPVCIKLLEN